eukprot:Gb_28977 [translate_table: standard]
MAVTSVTELVMAVKNPRSLSESTNRPAIHKSEGGGICMLPEPVAKEEIQNGSSVAPSRRNSHAGLRNSLSELSDAHEVGKKRKKSGLRSFMRAKDDFERAKARFSSCRCFQGKANHGKGNLKKADFAKLISQAFAVLGREEVAN